MKDINIYETMNTNMGGIRLVKGSLPKKMTDSDIKNLPDEFIESLECGDGVIKITKQDGRVMHHLYMVTYKEHHVGICLTYFAAGYLETQSYDYTDGHWVYNSEDKWVAE